MNAYSQLPVNKSWDYRYGGDAYEFPSLLLKTTDNGYLLSGNSLSGISFEKSEPCRTGLDYWIVKTDSSGNKIWDKTFGGSETDNLTCAIALPDSGFLLGGYSNSGISGDKSQPNCNTVNPSDDYWVVRTDKNGNKLWDKTFGGDKKDRLNALLLLPDGNYLLGGYSFSDSTGDMSHYKFGDNDFWLIKIDVNGNKIWDVNYGGEYDDRLISLRLTSDQGIILAGYSNSPAGDLKSQPPCNFSYDYWIVKMNQGGKKVWDRTFGGTSKDYFSCMTLLPGDKMVLCGVSFPGMGCDKSQPNVGNLGYTDYWVVCTDSSGNKLWDRVYGGDRNEDELNNVSVIKNGILITGTSYSFITGSKTESNVLSAEQPWLLAIDTLGNKLWDKTIHNPTHTEFCYGFQENDGCYTILCNVGAAGGYVSQSRTSTDDYWLAKFCAANTYATADFIASSNSLCQNSCIDFANMSQNATSYRWIFPGGTPAADTSANPQGICYFNDGVYDVTLIASDSTLSDTLTFSNYLTVHPMVQFTPMTQRGDTLFSVPGFADYKWYFDTMLIAGAHNYYHVAVQTGSYSVLVTDSNGCQALASLLEVISDVNNKLVSKEDFDANYHSGSLYLNYETGPTKHIVIELTNALGKIIYTRKHILYNNLNIISLPVETFAAGNYFIKIKSLNSTLVIKFFHDQ